uniref:Uncharacterized protein n=1 Tax=Arion vulgaris TaxID=1028688 RepID=A0A0B7AXV3_9EUPU
MLGDGVHIKHQDAITESLVAPARQLCNNYREELSTLLIAAHDMKSLQAPEGKIVFLTDSLIYTGRVSWLSSSFWTFWVLIWTELFTNAFFQTPRIVAGAPEFAQYCRKVACHLCGEGPNHMV